MLRMPGCIAAVLTVLITTSIVSGAPSKAMASVGELSGKVMVQRDAVPSAELKADSEFGSGDLLTLTDGAQVEIKFKNGSLLNIVGPAEIRLIQMDMKATQVALMSGLINVARAGRTPMTILTEYSVSVIVKNATGYAEVVPDSRMRFANRKGEGVSVLFLDEEKQLKAGDLPLLLDLKKLKLPRKPVGPVRGARPNYGTGEFVPSKGQYLLGRRVIRIYPADKVTVEVMSDGGLRVTGANLGENEFARVEVGREAVLYITNGEVVVLDRHGNVNEFTGRTFVERPIDPRAFDWEPVKDAADSSTIRTRSR